MTKDQISDYKRFFKEQGDPGFSVEHNKKVIEDSIRKADLMREKKMKAITTSMRHRSQMAVDYLFSRKSDTQTLEQYFGKHWMGYLRGNELMGELQGLNNRFVK